MSPIFSRFLVPAAVFCALASAPVRAAPVDVELVLAVDASGSVDEEEYVLQRAGYAKAFSHPRAISIRPPFTRPPLDRRSRLQPRSPPLRPPVHRPTGQRP